MDFLNKKPFAANSDELSIPSQQRRSVLKLTSLALISYSLGLWPKTASGGTIQGSYQTQQSNLSNESNDIINIIRSGLLFGLSQIPDIGSFLSLFVSLFWPPSQEDVWDEIKQRVEQMINQKIDAAVYQLIKNDLSGLSNNLKAYLESVKTDDPNVISENFVACHQIFINELPQFQSPERQEQLLPLFALFGILHLSLLREGILNANKMGWNAATKQMYTNEALNRIKDYGDYIDKIYSNIQVKADKKGNDASQNDPHKILQFYYSNECRRVYQVAVLDFRALFPYFDPIKYPSKVTVNLSRTVYFGPIGTNDDSDNQAGIEHGRDTMLCPPSSFSLYSGGCYISDNIGYDGAVVGYTVRYPSGFGPHSNNNNFFGRYKPDDGNTWIDCSEASGGPVTEIWTNDNGLNMIIYSLAFVHKNGNRSPVAGGCQGSSAPNHKISLPGHIVTDIAGQSNSVAFGALGCIIVGFQLENMGHSNDPTLILPLLYVSSMQEPTTEELNNAVKHISIENLQFILNLNKQPPNINTYISNNLQQWKQARDDFWASCNKALIKTQLQKRN